MSLNRDLKVTLSAGWVGSACSCTAASASRIRTCLRSPAWNTSPCARTACYRCDHALPIFCGGRWAVGGGRSIHLPTS